MAEPFRVSRFQRAGQNVDAVPMIHSMDLKPVRVENLKLVPTSTQAYRTMECTEHDRCLGHLFEGPHGRIILPRYVVSNEEEFQDRRAALSSWYLSCSIGHTFYGAEIRKTLMGKLGMMRNHLLACKPQTSMRGVATCVWSLKSHEVLIPRSWAARIKVPYRKSSEFEISPIWSYRPVQSGDRGVLLRCPITTVSSVQPIIVGVWDELSIGVSPELCDPLNLDFDGDEVHIAIVSSKPSVSEIDSLMPESGLSKFSPLSVARSMGISPNDLDHNSGDYMLESTCTLSSILSGTAGTSADKISKVKDGGREFIRQRLLGPQPPDVESLEVEWLASVRQMAESHLSVPVGYTISRQMKVLASTVRSFHDCSVPSWALHAISPGDIVPGSPIAHLGKTVGLPGVRLASRLGGKVTQVFLDAAKKSVDTSLGSVLRSLVSSTAPYFHVIRERGHHRLLRGQLPTSVPYDLIATTDPRILRNMGRDSDLSVSCTVMLRLACAEYDVQYTDSELIELSSLIYYLVKVKGDTAFASPNPTPILSTLPCDWLTGSVVDNITVLDKAASKACNFNTSSQAIHPSMTQPYVALIIGNIMGLRDLSASSPPWIQSRALEGGQTET